MLYEILRLFVWIGKKHPIKSTLLFLLSAGYIASLIAGPKLFVDGLDDVRNTDKTKADGHFAGAYALFAAILLIPLLQDRILTKMGTDLGQKLFNRIIKALFNLPMDTERNPTQGQNFEVVDHAGGTGQPGGVTHALLPVNLHVTTEFFAMLALVIYMGITLGSVAWIPAVQFFLFILIASAMTKPVGEATGGFINPPLYGMFSRTIVVGYNFFSTLILGQQSQVRKKYMEFIRDTLNPATRKYLNMNLYALMMTAVLGPLSNYAAIVWGVHKNLSANDLISLGIYSALITFISITTMVQIIAGVSAWALLIFALKYILKSVREKLPDFSADHPASIHVENVSCKYPGKTTPVSEPLSFDVKAGEVIAITGKNGSGKTTILKKFCKILDHKEEEGEIKLAGQGIRTFDRDSFLRHCAFIHQDAKVLEGSIKYNICVRYPDATDELIKKLIIDVDLVTKVLKKEEGRETEIIEPYDPNTIIGFDRTGPTISGGEQQKILIARALLDIIMGKEKGPEIKYLFLDEFLKGIDQESQPKVLQAVSKIVQEYKVTTIIVTHNLEQLPQYFPTIREIRVRKIEQPAEVRVGSNRNSIHAQPRRPDHVAMDIAADPAPGQEGAKDKERIEGKPPAFSPV